MHRQQHVICRLSHLARTSGSRMKYLLTITHGFKDYLRSIKSVSCTTAHKGQSTCLCCSNSTGNRRVHKLNTLLRNREAHIAGGITINRAGI